MAFAGCAKTTTSVEYAHAWSQHPGLYLAFNNGIANEAKGKFPSHIQTQTAHAHAYMILGVRRYNDRLTPRLRPNRSEEHTSELQSLMRISYAVFCLKKKNQNNKNSQ